MTFCGYKIRQRDERGWRIPRDGTKARRIYDLMVQGYKAKKISEILGCGRYSTEVAACRIRQPEHTNALQCKNRNKIRDWRLPPLKDSLFVPLKGIKHHVESIFSPTHWRPM